MDRALKAPEAAASNLESYDKNDKDINLPPQQHHRVDILRRPVEGFLRTFSNPLTRREQTECKTLTDFDGPLTKNSTMVQGKIIKRLLGHPTTPATNEAASNAPAQNVVTRPAFPQDANFQLSSPLSCLDISPAGTHAVVAGDKTFKTLKIEGTDIIESTDLRAAIRNPGDGISGSGDGLKIGHVRWCHGELDSIVVTASTNGRIAVYDLNKLQSGFEVGRIREHQRQVHKLSVNPFRGNLLLTASQDGTVRFFDIKSPPGRSQLTFLNRAVYKTNQDPVRDVKWSPNKGFEFACCTSSGSVQHWDTRVSKAPLLRINAHELACLTISWHADGEHLISGGLDNQCHVWDLSRDSNKRQKPKHAFTTPAPVSIVSWRPGYWSNSAQANRAAQVVTVYDDVSSLKTQNSTVHVWDLARPGLPFKALCEFETPPGGIAWSSTDMMWSVSREGVFRQSDLAHARKVVDNRALSTFSFSPTGEILLLLEERQQKLRHPPATPAAATAGGPIATPDHKPINSSSRTRLSMSSTSPSGNVIINRSDSEEDTHGNFLTHWPKPVKKKVAKPGSQPVTRTQSNASATHPPMVQSVQQLAEQATLGLEDSLKTGGQFIPTQVMAIGRHPSSVPKQLYEHISNRCLEVLITDLADVNSTEPLHMRVAMNMAFFALAAQEVQQYRLAQTWKILSQNTCVMLERRATLHRDQRLARIAAHKAELENAEEERLKKMERMRRMNVSERTPTKKNLDDGQDTKKERPRSVLTIKDEKGTLGRLKVEEESTSEMPTPIARPVMVESPTSSESSQKPLSELPKLDRDSFALPASLHAPQSGPSTSMAKSPGRRSPAKGMHGAHDSLEGGYDFYDLETLAVPSAKADLTSGTQAMDIAKSPAKVPLRLDMPSISSDQQRPGRVERHDSNESFDMFSTSGESPYPETEGSVSLPHGSRGSAHMLTASGTQPGNITQQSSIVTPGFGLQSSDFDSSWDSPDMPSNRRKAGYESVDSEMAASPRTSIQAPQAMPQEHPHRPRKGSSYFPQHPEVTPRSVPLQPFTVTAPSAAATDSLNTDSSSTDSLGAAAIPTGDAHDESDPIRPSEAATKKYAAFVSDEEALRPPSSETNFGLPFRSGLQTPSALEDDNPEIIPSDYIAHPSDPNFFGVPTLDPHVLVPAELNFSLNRWCFSAALLILAFRPHLKPDTLDSMRCAAILATFHERLTKLKCHHEAAMLRKLCYPEYPSVFSQGMARVVQEVGYACESPGCNGRLKKANLRVGERLRKCERCSGQLAACVVCTGHDAPLMDLPPKPEDQAAAGGDRIWVYCQGCGHGGHSVCLNEYHKAMKGLDIEGCCPADGCGHPCLPGRHRTEHLEMMAKKKQASLSKSVRSELDVGNRSGTSTPGAGFRSRRSSFERDRSEYTGLSGVGGRERVRRDDDEIRPSRAVDALRLGERDAYREMKEAKARDGKDRRKSVKVMAPGEEEPKPNGSGSK